MSSARELEAREHEQLNYVLRSFERARRLFTSWSKNNLLSIKKRLINDKVDRLLEYCKTSEKDAKQATQEKLNNFRDSQKEFAKLLRCKFNLFLDFVSWRRTTKNKNA